jgi:hypothetical protein
MWRELAYIFVNLRRQQVEGYPEKAGALFTV